MISKHVAVVVAVLKCLQGVGSCWGFATGTVVWWEWGGVRWVKEPLQEQQKLESIQARRAHRIDLPSSTIRTYSKWVQATESVTLERSFTFSKRDGGWTTILIASISLGIYIQVENLRSDLSATKEVFEVTNRDDYDCINGALRFVRLPCLGSQRVRKSSLRTLPIALLSISNSLITNTCTFGCNSKVHRDSIVRLWPTSFGLQCSTCVQYPFSLVREVGTHQCQR